MQLFEPQNFFLLFGVLFIVRFVVFSTLEYFFSAHPFAGTQKTISDLAIMALYLFLIYPCAVYISGTFGIEGTFFSHLSQLPLVIRILLYFIIGDFIHYWLHVLMHQPYLWRIHSWHHSFTHMSWIAGVRATVLDTALINTAFIFAWPILGGASPTTKILLLFFGVILNDWMHLNVSFRSPLFEKFFITPRYHHIHHSSDENHYTKNLAAVFPIWDKLFGTYSNPDKIEGKLSFGISEKVPKWRIILGL